MSVQLMNHSMLKAFSIITWQWYLPLLQELSFELMQ